MFTIGGTGFRINAMTSIIRVTGVSGAGDESPHCYLLDVDGFNILLDCGWDENFSMDFIKVRRFWGKSSVAFVDLMGINFD